MNTLVLYYSYSGKTERIATEHAEQIGAHCIALKDQKLPSTVSAYVFGSFRAMRRKLAKLQPVSIDWEKYDNVVIALPIWAGNPAPAFQNICQMLPGGKAVTLLFTSGGGDSSSSKEKSIQAITDRGCEVVQYKDIKTT